MLLEVETSLALNASVMSATSDGVACAHASEVGGTPDACVVFQDPATKLGGEGTFDNPLTLMSSAATSPAPVSQPGSVSESAAEEDSVRQPDSEAAKATWAQKVDEADVDSESGKVSGGEGPMDVDQQEDNHYADRLYIPTEWAELQLKAGAMVKLAHLPWTRTNTEEMDPRRRYERLVKAFMSLGWICPVRGCRYEFQQDGGGAFLTSTICGTDHKGYCHKRDAAIRHWEQCHFPKAELAHLGVSCSEEGCNSRFSYATHSSSWTSHVKQKHGNDADVHSRLKAKADGIPPLPVIAFEADRAKTSQLHKESVRRAYDRYPDLEEPTFRKYRLLRKLTRNALSACKSSGKRGVGSFQDREQRVWESQVKANVLDEARQIVYHELRDQGFPCETLDGSEDDDAASDSASKGKGKSQSQSTSSAAGTSVSKGKKKKGKGKSSSSPTAKSGEASTVKSGEKATSTPAESDVAEPPADSDRGRDSGEDTDYESVCRKRDRSRSVSSQKPRQKKAKASAPTGGACGGTPTDARRKDEQSRRQHLSTDVQRLLQKADHQKVGYGTSDRTTWLHRSRKPETKSYQRIWNVMNTVRTGLEDGDPAAVRLAEMNKQKTGPSPASSLVQPTLMPWQQVHLSMARPTRT